MRHPAAAGLGGSGHVGVFTDPLVECLHCHKRFRADHLIEDVRGEEGRAPENGLADIVCPNCGTAASGPQPRDFNMMLQTYLGPVEDERACTTCAPRPRRASS